MLNTDRSVDEYFSKVNDALSRLDRKSMNLFINKILETYDNGGTIYLFGNGGSGANASHICGDMLKGLSYGKDKRFRAVCLNDNNAAMMALANDVSYDDIFVEQLKNFLTDKDLVVGLSGSGNSMNVVKALEYAKSKGASTVALCGYTGGKIKEIADIPVHVPIDDMEISEDVHLVIAHCMKRIIYEYLKK